MHTDMEQTLADLEARQRTVALEALQHVYAHLPWGLTFQLADGRWARLVKFVEPRERAAEDLGEFAETEVGRHRLSNQPECGFDLKIGATREDVEGDRATSHLEFMVSNTGWGGAP